MVWIGKLNGSPASLDSTMQLLAAEAEGLGGRPNSLTSWFLVIAS